MSATLDILSTPVAYSHFSTYSAQRKRLKETSQQEHYRKHVIIFGLTWICDDDSHYLVGCTSLGELVCWKFPAVESEEKLNLDYSKAILRKKICQGKLYSIKSTLIGTKRLLIVSGDDGVLVFDWVKDILNTHLQQASKQEQPLVPTKQFRPYPSPLESRGVEVNDVQVLPSESGACIFGAAGDSFGVYKWDLESEKLISNYTSPGSGYLHSIALVPGEGGSRPSALLAGGEGGRLEFWDINQDKSMGQIDLTIVSAADACTSTTPGTAARTTAKRTKTVPSRWISSICAYDANWFTVGGGSSANAVGSGPLRGSSNNGSSSGPGYVATYHQKTRSLVSWTDTREIPQQLAVLPSAMESSVQHSLISVANENVVSHFNALSLDATRRQWCSPPSGYATAVTEKHTALAGVGCLVDVFDNSTGEKGIQLTIC